MASKYVEYLKKDDKRFKGLTYNDFAYYDNSVNRWRAGQYNNQHKSGSFISERTARNSRNGATTAVRASHKANMFRNQQGLGKVEAYKQAYQLQKDINRREKRYRQQNVQVPSIKELAKQDALQQAGLQES